MKESEEHNHKDEHEDAKEDKVPGAGGPDVNVIIGYMKEQIKSAQIAASKDYVRGSEKCNQMHLILGDYKGALIKYKNERKYITSKSYKSGDALQDLSYLLKKQVKRVFSKTAPNGWRSSDI